MITSVNTYFCSVRQVHCVLSNIQPKISRTATYRSLSPTMCLLVHHLEYDKKIWLILASLEVENYRARINQCPRRMASRHERDKPLAYIRTTGRSQWVMWHGETISAHWTVVMMCNYRVVDRLQQTWCTERLLDCLGMSGEVVVELTMHTHMYCTCTAHVRVLQCSKLN